MIASGGGRKRLPWTGMRPTEHCRGGWRACARRGQTVCFGRRGGENLPRRDACDRPVPAAFVIAKDGEPVGPIDDSDSVIFFNFRGDRAIEISKAFEYDDFDKFDRVRRPRALFAGILEYDADMHIPSRYLVSPPEIVNTMGEYLVNTGITQLAISETQKYGHVTYFWNGNRSGKFSDELETYIEIPSDCVPFEQRPWMKCAEITDRLIECIESGKYFLRVNY